MFADRSDFVAERSKRRANGAARTANRFNFGLTARGLQPTGAAAGAPSN
jgi:hypothetical protein